MTTDPFTDAARAEAEARYPRAADGRVPQDRWPFKIGAGWARAHLAAQEPTDAEADALVDSLDWAIRGTTDGDLIDQDSELPVGEVVRLIHEGARAALSAARAARRDEETTDE